MIGQLRLADPWRLLLGQLQPQLLQDQLLLGLGLGVPRQHQHPPIGCRDVHLEHLNLAHPGAVENLKRVNQHVKRRELWRPLAPSVLAEYYHEVFDIRQPSPFMLLAGQVRPHWKTRLAAVVHVDGSARPQAVCVETNPLFHLLISHFQRLSGLPAVLNTSFNHADEPLVNSPENAIATFYRTDIETLVIGNYVVRKAL